MSIINKLKTIFWGLKEQDPAAGYDWWAPGYDNQPGNLMLDLDEQVFTVLMDSVDLKGKTVVDIGCGSGRHWSKLYRQEPERLIGYDVSAGMLSKLKEKFTTAETHLLKEKILTSLPYASCDIIVSTLAIAHIDNIAGAFKEWNRIIRSGGEIIITDYHPAALAKGGKRTFKHNGKLAAVKNFIHPIDKIRNLARQLNWTELRFTEKIIDDSVKAYYQQQNAMAIFEKFSGVPIIYGIHLKKPDDPS
jgi:ubiquinone/menaquinone biosynthesis C-methylase UbiE